MSPVYSRPAEQYEILSLCLKEAGSSMKLSFEYELSKLLIVRR